MKLCVVPDMDKHKVLKTETDPWPSYPTKKTEYRRINPFHKYEVTIIKKRKIYTEEKSHWKFRVKF